MRARRIATIALGVTAALLLVPSFRSVFHSSNAGTPPARVVLDAPAANDTGIGPTGPATTEPAELESADAETPLPVPQSADTSGLWGQSFGECIAKRRLALFVCKQRLEPRDPIWAPAAEQRIRWSAAPRSAKFTYTLIEKGSPTISAPWAGTTQVRRASMNSST